MSHICCGIIFIRGGGGVKCPWLTNIFTLSRGRNFVGNQISNESMGCTSKFEGKGNAWKLLTLATPEHWRLQYMYFFDHIWFSKQFNFHASTRCGMRTDFVWFFLRFQTKRVQQRTFCVVNSWLLENNEAQRREEVVRRFKTIFTEYHDISGGNIYEYKYQIWPTFLKNASQTWKEASVVKCQDVFLQIHRLSLISNYIFVVMKCNV
jgi:hypothetical protein